MSDLKALQKADINRTESISCDNGGYFHIRD